VKPGVYDLFAPSSLPIVELFVLLLEDYAEGMATGPLFQIGNSSTWYLPRAFARDPLSARFPSHGSRSPSLTVHLSCR
jgi:hypothetical protein